MLFLALIALYAQSAPDWNARGTAALDEKRYTEAAEDFQKAVQADPKDYAAWFNLALANSVLKRDDDAIEGYRRVLELKPGLYEAELNLGIVLLRAKRAREAVQPLRAAVEAKPKEFRAQSSLAEALLAAKQFPDAEKAWTATLEINPKSASAEAGLAQTLIAQNRLADAEQHLRRAAELDPSYRSEILRLGEAYEAAGKPEAAIPIYLAFPDNAGALERAGQLLLGAGRPADAIPPLEAAVKRSPTAANRAALAAAYKAAKRPDDAANILAQALQANPADYDLRMMAGRLLRDERKFPEAAGQFFQATKLKPGSVEAWNELAGALVLSEQYPEAVAALDRIRALGAETSAHHYFRALSLDHLHQFEPALEAYRRFLETDGGKRPDEEFKARQRVRILEKEARKR